MRRPNAPVLAVAGAVLGVGLLAGCGAPSTGTAYKTSVSADSLSPAAAVRAATSATANAGSASFTLTLTADDGTAPTTVEVRGKADLDGSSADLSATIPGDGGPTTVRQRVVDGVVYLKVEGSDVLPATWVKLDPAALPEGAGQDLGGMLGGAGSGTVTAPLDALREVAEVEKVGTQEIDGIATTHYRATLDPAKLAAAFGPLESMGLGGAAKLGAGTMPVDLWVDAEGRVVRVSQSVDLSAADAGTISWTLDLREFGEPLELTAPESALDLGSLLGSLGDLGSLLDGSGDGAGSLEDLSGLVDGLLGGGTTTS
jgi:hypothetical protein